MSLKVNSGDCRMFRCYSVASFPAGSQSPGVVRHLPGIPPWNELMRLCEGDRATEGPESPQRPVVPSWRRGSVSCLSDDCCARRALDIMGLSAGPFGTGETPDSEPKDEPD
jgi:hypothetical protein